MKNLFLSVAFSIISLFVSAQSYSTYDIRSYDYDYTTESYVEIGETSYRNCTFKVKEGGWFNWVFDGVSVNYKIVEVDFEPDCKIYRCLGKGTSKFIFYIYETRIGMVHLDKSEDVNSLFIFSINN